jgi:hypothetical protein
MGSQVSVIENLTERTASDFIVIELRFQSCAVKALLTPYGLNFQGRDSIPAFFFARASTSSPLVLDS